jgi:intracellular sulfur oxidation DsrE/DsrF family protein
MRTVFHLIDPDPDQQRTGLTVAENLLADGSVHVDDVVVVAQARGIEPVLADGDDAERVRTLQDEGITFRACGNTLESREMDETDLVDGVEVVPSGAGELTRLQAEDYAYIRP